MSENPLDSSIRSLLDEQLLIDRLAHICKRKKLAAVTVALRVGQETRFVAIKEGATALNSATACAQPIRAGCLAKPITATLAAGAVAEGYFDWSDEIDRLLPLDRNSRAKLHGITVQHLQNHTHGLDSSSVVALQHTPDGFIDAQQLCEHLDARSLSAPGSLYSYSNAGAWLTGALLERVYGKRYSQLLQEQDCLNPATMGADLRQHIQCPSTGRDTALTATQWLTFAEHHTDDYPGRSALRVLRDTRTPLPGWHPTERAMCLGWKYYGDDCFGHNSDLLDQSIVFRIIPTTRTTVMVAVSGSGEAIFVLAGLLGSSLPEFRNLRPPRLLTPDEIDPAQFRSYAGRYSQSKTTFSVTSIDEETLHFSMYDSIANSLMAQGQLRPAQAGLFLVDAERRFDMSLIQFVRNPHSGEIEHVWNGKQLWRKVE